MFLKFKESYSMENSTAFFGGQFDNLYQESYIYAQTLDLITSKFFILKNIKNSLKVVYLEFYLERIQRNIRYITYRFDTVQYFEVYI